MTNKFTPIMRIAAWIIVFAVLLGGCASHITSGEVYRKEFLPEHTYVTMMPVVTFNGDKWLAEDFYVSPEVYDAVQIWDIFDCDKQRLEE